MPVSNQNNQKASNLMNMDIAMYGDDINSIMDDMLIISRLVRMMVDPTVAMDPITREKELRRLIRTDIELRNALARAYGFGNGELLTDEQFEVLYAGTASMYNTYMPPLKEKANANPDEDDE